MNHSTTHTADIRITLLISTYNWPEALQKTLESIIMQTKFPDEVIIADDGSNKDTKLIIDEYRDKMPMPLIHVWHEDKGFRKTIIMNKAIAQATGNYIIQIDGDIVLEKHFIADHIEVSQKGYFVAGSRVKLSDSVTRSFLKSDKKTINIRNISLGYIPNRIRSRIMRKIFASRYTRNIHSRGCNMAFWRDDLIKVNGYDEDIIGWGQEDSELAFRLHNSGLCKKTLKMGGYNTISNTPNTQGSTTRKILKFYKRPKMTKA